MLGAVLLGHPASARSAGSKRTPDIAREIFAANLETSLGLLPGSFEVIPVTGVEDTGFHATLRTGDLYAWTALDSAGKRLISGFAGAGPGVQTAFEGFRAGIGHPGGLSALMEAVGILEPARRAPLDHIVDRVFFCLNRADRAESLFDAEIIRSSGFEPPDAIRAPSIRTQDGHAVLTCFTMVQGFTGTFDFWKITVTVAADHAVRIEREEV